MTHTEYDHTDHGTHAGQEVPHFHVHIFAGKPLGRMISEG